MAERRRKQFEAMQRRVSGALVCAIDAHGPIDRQSVGSAAKRVTGEILKNEPAPSSDEITVTLTRDELEALVGNRDGYIFEPPDECEHGFSPPSRCPNEGCPDQHVASAWHKLRDELSGAPAPSGDEITVALTREEALVAIGEYVPVPEKGRIPDYIEYERSLERKIRAALEGGRE